MGQPFILREAADLIVEAVETVVIGIEQATEALLRCAPTFGIPSSFC